MKTKSSYFLFFISLLFFLSGACGLVYEMIWVRKLGLIFGNTTFAISTVLAVYMGGLGLGSLFFGKRIDRQGHPLLWYGFLEIGVGVFCFLTIFSWTLVESFYVWAYQTFHLGFWQFSIFRFLLSFVFLFIPTFLMGGTLPLLIKFAIYAHRHTAKTVGFLYGINTLGAVLGVLITSFFAIYYLGLQGTVLIASIVNICIGLSAIFLAKLKMFMANEKNDAGEDPLPNEAIETDDRPKGRMSAEALATVLLTAFCFSGFASMAYELCWTRVLALCLGSSVYSFALMLASFLTGLALGSLVIGWISKRIQINFYLFGITQVLVAFFVIWGINTFDQMPFYFLQLFAVVGKSAQIFHVAKFILASLIILPPTIFIGCTFAIITQLLNRSSATTGKTVGQAYFINTLGCIAGSVVSGFILVPWIGIYKTLMAMVVINFLIGVAILIVSQERFSLRQAVLAIPIVILTGFLALQTHPWSQGLLTTNIAIDPNTYLGHNKFEILAAARQAEMLYYKEGLSGTVSVKRYIDNIALSVNSNIDASTGADMYTQLMLGHLPSLLSKKHGRALVIGMGSGVTLGALAAHDYQQIHCVELEGAVIEAAKYFSKENRNVLLDPRVKNFVNDGRNHLLVENFTYDVIISEPSNPWMAGVANLFTVEQFKLMKKHLSPQGIVCQWLNIYSMSPDNVRMIVKTFLSVFPRATLWQSTGSDLLLIGSDQSIVYDMDIVNQKIQENRALQEDLKEFKIYDAAGLLSCFVLDEKEVAMMSKGALMNTDNFPFLEYLAPLSLYGADRLVVQNGQMIEAWRGRRYPALSSSIENREETIDFHNAIARAMLYKEKYKEAGIEIGLSTQEKAFNKGAVLNYGILQVALNNPDEAIVNLENYLKEDPGNAEAYFYLGRAHDLKKQPAQALKNYQLAVETDPLNGGYLFACGESFVQNGQTGKGISFIRKGIELKGPDFRSRLILAQSLYMNKEFNASLDVLAQLLKEYPHSYVLHEALVFCYKALDQYPQAVSVYAQAVKLMPYDARVYYSMSLLYEAMGQAKKSHQMTKRYLYYQNAPKIGVIQVRTGK